MQANYAMQCVQISLSRGEMPPKKGKKGGKKQDDDWGEDDKKVNFSYFLKLTIFS